MEVTRLRTLSTKAAVFLIGLLHSLGTAAMESDQNIALPKPDVEGNVPLETTIKNRRSVRQYANRPLSLDDVSQLLWAAQGLTARDKRAAPSAGALYPLELYLVAGDVESLPAGVYAYEPRGHRLRQVADGDRREALAEAALDQAWVRRTPAVLVFTGVYERSAQKYGQRSRRYTQIEVGHAAQNVYLQAETRDIGTVMVGAFRDAEVQEALELPADHAPLALMPVGYKR